jgi:predicted TIM-barrel fold metal-dependent hydrolase
VPDPFSSVARRIGPVVDSNVHLWDQGRNPVFWLTDRTIVRDMLGNYDSLPDTYTLADYLDATSDCDVRGIVWSDAGAADPVAAAEWVAAQNIAEQVVGLVSLADPADPAFERLVRSLRLNPLVTSVRVRLVPTLTTGTTGSATAAQDRLLDGLGLLGDLGLVATIEAGPDRIGWVADAARRLPTVRLVLDHFGWPADLTDAGRRTHLDALRRAADASPISTRIDAIGTIFGAWDVDTIEPWLLGTVDAFGPDRCMLGSDLPIETLRSDFAGLYGAYDAILASYSDDDRRLLFGETARRVYGRS